MSLLPFIFAGIVIYFLIITPLIIAVLAINFLSKQFEFQYVSVLNSVKIISFYILEGFILFSIFAIFAGRPFSHFVVINNNLYLNLVVFLAMIITLGFFIFIHFNIFSLYLKRFYEASFLKRALLYISTTAAVWLIIFFYSNLINLTHRMIFILI